MTESLPFTEIQKNRLQELSVEEENIGTLFDDPNQRNKAYLKLEKEAVSISKKKINDLLQNQHQVELCSLRTKLEQAFCNNGFTEISTPTIISRKFLERMSIDGTHPLNDQVFWLDSKSCLRPMLAPNLYDVSKSLINFNKLPLRVFEIGSCFRKESEGKSHLKEFTMINVVEWGTPLDERENTIKQIAKIIMDTAGIDDYLFENEDSVVYGEGLDVVGKNGLELASTSMGPHKLDSAWGINSSWVGIGVGLERLLMYKNNANGIHRYAKSISFLNGVRLNIK